jgi:hypothetical protein
MSVRSSPITRHLRTFLDDFGGELRHAPPSAPLTSELGTSYKFGMILYFILRSWIEECLLIAKMSVEGVGSPVPQRRAADRERADVVIEESLSLFTFPPPSTSRISEVV